MYLRVTRSHFLLCTILLLFSYGLHANERDEYSIEDLFNIPLDELLKIKVTTASDIDESLKNAPGAMVIVTASEIAERGYQRFGEIFNDLPGFDVTLQYPQTFFYQRGFRNSNNQRTLFLINDVEAGLLWNQGGSFLGQLPISRIERVEILYGPVSAVHGANAFLGVVNIITKDAKNNNSDGDSLHAQIDYGSYNTKVLELGGGGKHGALSYNLNGRWLESNGPSLSDYPKEFGYTDESWLQNSDIWGPMLQQKNNNEALDEFHSPKETISLLVDAQLYNWKLGLTYWDNLNTANYGLVYSFDHSNPNAAWASNSKQLYLTNTMQASTNTLINSRLLWRSSGLNGEFIEAFPDADNPNYSYISFSSWRLENTAWSFHQDFDIKLTPQWQLQTGYQVERKKLSRNYDTCSYWSGGFCSSAVEGDDGPHGLGAGIGHSTDAHYTASSQPLHDMPSANLTDVNSRGLYLQTIFNESVYRLNFGVRYDDTSLWGNVLSPRLAGIYQANEINTIKLIYGEAFQEPPAKLIWGGFSGRKANPDLEPEKAKNVELIWINQSNHFIHDMSLFVSYYDNVIVVDELARNIGSKRIHGFEYRGRFEYDDVLGKPLKGYLYYTYTDGTDQVSYDHNASQWVKQDTKLGDIAKHKLNLGGDVTLNSNWMFNIRLRFIGKRELFSRNTLSQQNISISSVTLFDTSLRWNANRNVNFTLAVNNVFDRGYYYPGKDSADSGDNLEQRAGGFFNSLIPAEGRSLHLALRYNFN